MIKLLALDLDDTLLKEDLTISVRNKKAIRQAEELGVRVILASGRAFPAMERFAVELGMLDRPGFLISDNGSTVYATQNRNPLVAHHFHQPLVGQIFQAFAEINLPVQVYRGKTILVTKDNRFTSKDMELSGYSRKIDQHLAKNLDFLPQKFVIPGEPEELPAALDKIRGLFGSQINAFISKPYFLEVLPPLADKGSSLRFIAEKLKIEAPEIMAMGDAANDLGMIRYAGWGVAMANAVPEVKKAARLVTSLSHEEDGVAEIVEKYILQAQ